MNAPELSKEVKVSIGLLVSLAVGAFTLGGIVVKVLDNDRQLEDTKEFMLDEVNGLRTDWERRYRDNINPRLEKLEAK